MNKEPEKFSLIIKLVIVLNAALIAGMILLNVNEHRKMSKEQPCIKTQSLNADAINSVTIKLM